MNCCRYCVPPKRYPGCHDHCPDRAAELEEEAEKKAAVKKKNAVSQGIYQQKSDGVRRATKKHGRYKK